MVGVLGFVLLNPLALFGQGLYNIGTFNDLIFTWLVYLVLTAKASSKDYWGVYVANAVATYFDPRCLFYVFPLLAILKFRVN